MPISYDDVRKRFEAIKLALGQPPYTEEQIAKLFPITGIQDTVDAEALKALVWLASDFVQNWIDADNKRHAEKQG